MARSFRFFFDDQQGVVRHNINLPGAIDKKSAVVITAAQFEWPGGFGGLEDIRPLLGAAPVWVSNVGVHGDEGGGGGVEFLLHVDSGSPLDVMVTVTAFEDIEQYVH
jgi:hypothetical protein